MGWAGNGWGRMIVPRIGVVIVVESLESDPDKPLVTVCVSIGMRLPPIALPDSKTHLVFCR